MKFILLILTFFSSILYAQVEYEEILHRLEKFSENDEKAFIFINKFINKAKRENNLHRLFEGYKESTYYSTSNQTKLKYADSCIITAYKIQDNDLISSAYLGKGIVYYFNYRQYVKALDQYIIAYSYSEKGNDEYQKQKINYHIGVVKSYLGYYSEALIHFNNGIKFFRSRTLGKHHPNEIYNNSKGYLNSLHQAIICNQYLNQNSEADQLISEGLSFVKQNPEFALEKSYFHKCSGVSNYSIDRFQLAVDELTKSLPAIEKKDDFLTISKVNFYLGACYEKLGNTDQAIRQFKKVDSLFSKKLIFFPELRKNYEYLIRTYKNEGIEKEELFYTKKLLKVDSIMNVDFKYLSSKIHKDYDTVGLKKSKQKLEEQNSFSLSLLLILFAIILILTYFLYKYYKNQKEIKEKYIVLENKIINAASLKIGSDKNITSIHNKTPIPDEIYLLCI